MTYAILYLEINLFSIALLLFTFGHIEGDKALVHVADALRKACDGSHCLTARYGGDEFVVFSPADEAEKISGGIQACLQEASGTLPYALSVCIGTAKADRSKPLQALIAEADEKLYQQKRER